MPKRKQSSSVLSIVAYTPPQLYVGMVYRIYGLRSSKGKDAPKKNQA